MEIRGPVRDMLELYKRYPIDFDIKLGFDTGTSGIVTIIHTYAFMDADKLKYTFDRGFHVPNWDIGVECDNEQGRLYFPTDNYLDVVKVEFPEIYGFENTNIILKGDKFCLWENDLSDMLKAEMPEKRLFVADYYTAKELKEEFDRLLECYN